MNTQHTPGPWTFNLTTGVIRSISEEFPNCRQPVICDLRRWPSGDTTYIDSANARLIAAAPELLGALENLLKAIEWSETKPVHNLTTLGRAIAKAKTVITEATRSET